MRRVPVEPDADEARDLLIRELAEPAYRQAEPNWFDRLSSALWDWLTGLFDTAAGGPPALVWGVLLLVLAGAIVAAYLVFGPPRRNRRSAAADGLFADDDTRDAATLRSSAERAAEREDWPLAIEEMFRAAARGLAERAVLSTSPGTTANGFAARAGEYFPDLAGELRASASAFDDVRYLAGPGSRAAFSEVSELERELRASKPVLDAAGVLR